jgi:hypothetical protein
MISTTSTRDGELAANAVVFPFPGLAPLTVPLGTPLTPTGRPKTWPNAKGWLAVAVTPIMLQVSNVPLVLPAAFGLQGAEQLVPLHTKDVLV